MKATLELRSLIILQTTQRHSHICKQLSIIHGKEIQTMCLYMAQLLLSNSGHISSSQMFLANYL